MPVVVPKVLEADGFGTVIGETDIDGTAHFGSDGNISGGGAAVGNVGEDDRHITTVDADGVALAAIKGLNEKVERSGGNWNKSKRR